MSRDIVPRESLLPLTAEAAEGKELAKELCASRDRYVRWYAAQYEKSAKEASLVDAKWTDDRAAELVRTIEDEPADQVTWCELDIVAESSPALADATWRRIKEEAKDELASGWRAAKVAEADSHNVSPFQRARFLALRESLREEWQPRPGTESMLVDMLAQIHTTYEEWLGKHIHRMTYTGISVSREEEEYRKCRGQYITARVSEHEEIELTATMADRWQKAYLRTVRALKDLRRLSPQVLVQNAHNVNVAQQQVNL